MRLLTLSVCRLDTQLSAALAAKFGFFFQDAMAAPWALHTRTSVISGLQWQNRSSILLRFELTEFRWGARMKSESEKSPFNSAEQETSFALVIKCQTKKKSKKHCTFRSLVGWKYFICNQMYGIEEEGLAHSVTCTMVISIVKYLTLFFSFF